MDSLPVEMAEALLKAALEGMESERQEWRRLIERLAGLGRPEDKP